MTRPYVRVPYDLLEAVARRLYVAGDDMYREQIEGLLDAVRPQVIGPRCLSCEHPSTQHDDGGCLFPKWGKSGGTTCYCAAFQSAENGPSGTAK